MLLTFWKKIIFRCILVLMSFVIALTLCEAVVRIWVAFTNRIPLTTSNAHTGWVLSPNLRNQVRVDPGGRFVISTNDDGYRLTTPAEQSQPETTPVVMIRSFRELGWMIMKHSVGSSLVMRLGL